MTGLLLAAVVIGAIGIIIGVLLGIASEKFKVEVDEKEILVRADLVTYSHGEYFTLGKKIGTFGYSVAKNKPQSIAGNNPKHKSKSSTKKGVKAKGRSGKHTRKEKGKR